MSSTLFLARDLSHLNELNLFFEIAFQCSELGLVSLIITKRIDVFGELHKHPFIGLPNVLERIHFKYLSSKAEILLWCRAAHESRVKPNFVFVVDFEAFVGEDSFNSVELCAALQDVTNFFRSSNKFKWSHLVMAFSNETHSSLRCLLSLFENIYNINDTIDNKTLQKIYPKNETPQIFNLYNPEDNFLEENFVLNLFNTS